MKVLYYWLYKILSKTRREEDPGFATMIVLGFMIYWNIITIIKESLPQNSFSMPKEYAIIMGITITPIIFIPLYLFLYRKRIEVKEHVEKYSPKRYRNGKIMSYLYFALSIVSTFYFLLNK